MQLLSDNRIQLRALEPTDLDIILQWENNPAIWEVGATTAPLSRHQIWEYLQNYSADIFTQRQLRLMATERDSFVPVGMVDLFDFDPFHNRAYIGLLIAPEHTKKGFGFATMQLVIDYAKNYLGLHQLAANIPATNTASLQLFSKLGFSQSGILKDWIKKGTVYTDVVAMQLIINS